MLTMKCVAQLWDYNKTNTHYHDLHKHIEAKRKIAKFCFEKWCEGIKLDD